MQGRIDEKDTARSKGISEEMLNWLVHGREDKHWNVRWALGTWLKW
jgi:hypothetical protein